MQEQSLGTEGVLSYLPGRKESLCVAATVMSQGNKYIVNMICVT